jgi:hypothetical protein
MKTSLSRSLALLGISACLSATPLMAQETCENCQSQGSSTFAGGGHGGHPAATAVAQKGAAVYRTVSPLHPATGMPNGEYRGYAQNDLFRQYYVPNHQGGVGAQLYVAPRPVPEFVGHTWYTYQPLYPHEFMYRHHRTYHRYYDDGRGLTRTSVRWAW